MNVPPDAMPGACHPAYADMAQMLRSSGFKQDLFVPRLAPMSAQWTKSDQPTEARIRTRVLTYKKVYAPAPYVGKPFIYVWRCLVDELGRYVGPDPEQVEIVSDERNAHLGRDFRSVPRED